MNLQDLFPTSRGASAALALALTLASFLPGAALGQLTSGGESDPGDDVACGPAMPPPVVPHWGELPDELSGAELPGGTVHLQLTNTLDYAVQAQVVITVERFGRTTDHPLQPVLLPGGGEVEVPLNLLSFRSEETGQGDRSTSFIYAHLIWLSGNQEGEGHSVAPVLYFFQRPTGEVSAFREGQLAERHRPGGDAPEARYLDSLDLEEGEALEMAFAADATGPRPNPVTFDHEADFAEESRLREEQRRKAATDTVPNRETDR